MAISRRPKATEKPEEEVLAFIQEGGSTPAQVIPLKSEPSTTDPRKEVEKGLKLRLAETLLQRVDQAVAQRRPSPSRHQWILEAIYEKLDREENTSA